MFVHCLIRRDGPTPVTAQGMKYLFMPIPGRRKGEQVTSICEINDAEHIARLLKSPQFVEWDEAAGERELRELRAQETPLAGFGVEPHGRGEDAGYIAVDRRDKKTLYAGFEQEWTASTKNLKPFQSEKDAYDFLVEFTGAGDVEARGGGLAFAAAGQ